MNQYRLNLKKRLRNREKLFGGWISFDHPSIAEIFSFANFDFISIDMEHAPISLESAQNLFSRIQANQVACLPRPVSHSNDIIKPLLDSGCDGLIVQMVNTYDEAKEIIKNLKYPPNGNRTYGVNRAHSYGIEFNNYINEWNNSSSLIIQIESKEGVNNIDKILSLDEIDGVMVGPYDLSGSYGFPGDINNHIVKDATQKIINSCVKNHKSCGTQISHPSAQSVKELFNQGYTFSILGSDLFILWKWVEEMKELIQNEKRK